VSPASVGPAQPSEVDDVDWLYAKRKIGTYPARERQGGKWLIFVSPENVDGVWSKIATAVEAGRLGDSAKVATARQANTARLMLDSFNRDGQAIPKALTATLKARVRRRVLCIYTYDASDERDVWRVRQELSALGFTETLYYKTDKDTLDRTYSRPGGPAVSKYFG
jgi:hypothetical protein